MKEKYFYKPVLKNSEPINVWLTFPYTYMYGMSTLGYLTLFKELDTNKDVFVERIFQDTQEVKTDLDKVNLLGFSCIFDNDIFSILKLLERYNIPLQAKDRENMPLIFAGGPVMTTNPEPCADIFDFMLIGDGEGILNEVVQVLKNTQNLDKQSKLIELSKTKGVYVPSLYNVEYNKDLSISKINSLKKEAPIKISKNTTKLDECIYSPIVSSKAFYSDSFFIEVARGCSHKCKFCTASFYNLPTRYPSLNSIKEAIDIGIEYAKNIVLIGAMIADHPDFDEICEYLIEQRKNKPFNLEFSSVRADVFNEKAAQALLKCGKEEASIAIESASQIQRDKINKNLTDNQLKEVISGYANAGFKKLNIYLMIGLPEETKQDIENFITLAKELKTENPYIDINYIVSTFIPKPNTPYQRKPRESFDSLESKQNYLKKNLEELEVNNSFSNLHQDFLSSVMSRGDRRLNKFILAVYKEKITAKNWREFHKRFVNCSVEDSGQQLPPLEWYGNREFDKNEILPWDSIQFCENNEICVDSLVLANVN